MEEPSDKITYSCGVIGVILGIIVGFKYAGIGGAIVGIVLEFIGGLFAALIGYNLIVEVIPGLIGISLILLAIGSIIYLISLLWNVGNRSQI